MLTGDGAERNPHEPRAEHAVSRANRKRSLRDIVRDAIVDSFYARITAISIDWLLANPRSASGVSRSVPRSGPDRQSGRLESRVAAIPQDGRVSQARSDPKSSGGRRRTGPLQLRCRDCLARWRKTSLPERRSTRSFAIPRKRLFFDRTAKRLRRASNQPNIVGRRLRLRKASRELVDEVKQYHFVFAKRDFSRFQTWRRFEPIAL